MIRQKMIPNGRKHYTHSCGRAGDVSIDLFNGKMTYTHKDFEGKGPLPVQISHVYSDINNNQVQLSNGLPITLAGTKCGPKFRLNIDKRLIKEPIGYFNGESSYRYILMDADGTETIFDEKFFYKKGNQKVFVLAQDVSIAQSGELSCADSNNITRKVEREFISESGLVLSGKYEGIKNIERINQDIDEVAQLKSEIKATKQTLLEVANSLLYNEENKLLCEARRTLNVSQDTLQRQNLFANLFSCEKQDEVEEDCEENLAFLSLQVESSRSKAEAAKKLYDDTVATDPNSADIPKLLEEYNELKLIFDIQMINYKLQINQKQITYGEMLSNNSRREGTLYYQKESNRLTREILDDTQSISTDQYELEIKQLDDERSMLTERQKEYEINLEQMEYQLAQLLKKIPEYYITDSDGKTLGFAQLNKEGTKDYDIYRLIMISDSYENAILVYYDHENKITRVINSDEKEIVFNYNDDDLLESMVDDKGRKISYSYSGFLTEIKYPNGKITKLHYEGGYLTAIFSPNKKGVALTYIDDKASEIKGLSQYKKIGNDILEEVTTNDETIGILGVNYLITSKKKINYVDYRTTVILDEKTGKTHTHLMNIYGETICEYDCKSSSADAMKEAYNVSYNLLTDRKQFVAKPYVMAEELLTDSTFFTSTGSELYLGEDIIVGVAYATEINTQIQVGEDENVYSASHFANKKAEKTISDATIGKIKSEGITDLMFGAWAKAENSDPVLPKFTDYSENGETDDNIYYDEEYYGDTSNIESEKKFELRAEITYIKGDEVVTKKQYASFDYKNTGWQYVAFPVTLLTDENFVLSEIKVVFDFSGQSGDAEFYGMSLKEADWKYTELNEYKQVIYSEANKSELVVTYEYDEERKLIKETSKHKTTDEEVVTEYSYNANKSPTLVIDSLGNVTENEYDSKGAKIRSISYNKGMAGSKYYEEAKKDETGKEIETINEFGETVCEYEYSESDVLTNEKHPDGTKVGYGYDEYEDTLLEITSTVEGKTNSNTYEYTDELVTGLTHNGTKYRFTYDAEGRKIKTHINDILYEDITINNILDKSGVLKQKETDKMFATGERVYITEDADGKIIKMEYTNNGGTRRILNNIYDTCGNLIRTEDKVTNTMYDFIYDKYGRIVEKISSNNGKVIKVANTYNNDDSIAETSFEIDGVRKTSTNTYTESVFDRKLTRNPNTAQHLHCAIHHFKCRIGAEVFAHCRIARGDGAVVCFPRCFIQHVFHGV